MFSESRWRCLPRRVQVKNSRILEKPYLFGADVGFKAADLDAALEAGEAMTITVTGAGLPYSQAPQPTPF